MKPTEPENGSPPRNQRGVRHLVAIALVLLDLDVVRYATLRDLLPRGERRKSGGGVDFNVVSKKFSSALRVFERAGYLRRLDGHVEVINRDGLRVVAGDGDDVTDGRAAFELELAATCARLVRASELAARSAEPDPDRAQRELELAAIDRLMRQGPGAVGRPGVRIVPRPGGMV